MGEPSKAETRARMASPGGWGYVADANKHTRYAVTLPPKSRMRCRLCPCRRRATHYGAANGLGMTTGGCELAVRRWVREGPGARP